MLKTTTKTIYPDLVDNPICNSIEFIKLYSNYLESIGSISSPLSSNNSTSTSYSVNVKLDAYFSSNADKGRISSITNEKLTSNSLAVNSSIIPIGSRVDIPGAGQRIADDIIPQVIEITGNVPVICLFFNTKEEATSFLRANSKEVTVTVTPQNIPQQVLPSKKQKGIESEANSFDAGDLSLQMSLALNYWKALRSGDPVTSLKKFYLQLNNTVFNDLNNDFIFYWFKKFNNTLNEIKDSLSLKLDSVLSGPSDSVGSIVNSKIKFNDNVSPYFDVFCSMGGPNQLPASVLNKLSAVSRSVYDDLNIKTTSLQRNNLINIQKVSEDDALTNLKSDTTVAHGTNLVTDYKFYLDFYNNLSSLVSILTDKFKNTLPYIAFFSNFNDNTAYNPRDTLKNIQKIENIYFQKNIENKIVQLDLLQNISIPSLKDKTIKSSLNVSVATTSNTKNTQSINNTFLNKENDTRLPIPVSNSSSAKAKNAASVNKVKEPNAKLVNLNSNIQKQGLKESKNDNNMASTVANNEKTTQKPTLDTPNTLPSKNSSEFSSIGSIATGLQPGDPNISASLSNIEQAKNVACDFKLPEPPDINFDLLTNSNVDFNPTSLLSKLGGFSFNLPKLDGFVSSLTSLIPNFNELWKGFNSKLFDCKNKNDY